MPMLGCDACDVFFSYNSRDREVVEHVAKWVRGHGVKPFLDRWYLVPGQPWVDALEGHLGACRAAVVFIGPGEMGPWQQREKNLALDIQGRRSGFAVIPVLLPGCDPVLGFLGQNTWVDLRQGLADSAALAILTRAIAGQAPGPEEEQSQGGQASFCPYRGLAFFREEDAPFFFGRNAAEESLCAGLDHRRLIAVVGASGSGKSSVVRAGLLPALRRLRHPTREIVCFFPGDEPFARLAAAVLPLLEPEMTEISRLLETEKLASALRSGELPVARLARRLLEKQRGTERLLLVIDQWEELYTLTREESTRQRFVDAILDATRTDQPVPIDVVFTLRGDFVAC